MSNTMGNVELWKRLAAPFPANCIKWKPGVLNSAKTRALALAYLDGRAIQDRLDEVLGVDGWSDQYVIHPDGHVICTLTARFGDREVSKADVGAPTKGECDPLKAAFTGSFKRAAVKFGVGRYLYGLQGQWVGYDPQAKRFTEQPKLPAAFLPESEQPATPTTTSKKTPPANGAELRHRLTEYDKRLATAGVCKAGELLTFLASEGDKAGHGRDLSRWNPGLTDWAAGVTRAFENGRRVKAGKV